MHRHKTTQEKRLRAACDRCGELKNRCVRTGGPESRCDRCDRLDIDCVYRNTSRMGRPKTQANENIAVNSGSGTTSLGENENPTLNESQSDLMGFLVSPDDWGRMDFSQPIHPINDSFGHVASPALPPFEPVTCPDSSGVTNKEQIADRLLQLQGQVHRLLSAMDRQPVINYIEEGLQVTKSFLEILQASMDLHGLTENSSAAPRTAALSPGRNNGGIGVTTASSCPGVNIPAAGVNFIMVEQALLCYSYVLHMLDRVVNALTANIHHTDSTGLEPAVTLSLGFFSLASQPALNAGVILHIMLRMVQHLRVLIQRLASGCKDLTDRPSSPPDSAVDMGNSPWKTCPSSIAVTSYNMANLVCEKEKVLIERLSYSTSSF